MEFKDKIAKKRKENNLSQEALAEKLFMSRQAISKWENGSSYPDMATMIKICKILNCSLEDLLDDDAMGNTNIKDNKINPNKYLKEILDFITKTYNMFWSMKFIDKIKCLCEMFFLILILVLLSTFFGQFLKGTVLQIFNFLPDNIYMYLCGIFGMLYYLIVFIIIGVIVIHLFKIRYLDYFITIEDDSVVDKNVEEDKTDNKKIINERKKEKIIIRDPKHTTYSFFGFLAKIILIVIKIFASFIIGLLIFSFIFFTFVGTVSIIWSNHGFIFICLLVIVLGVLLVNYCFLELLYKFLFNRSYNFIRIFILFVSGLFITGIGSGLFFIEFTKFDMVDYDYNINLNTKRIELDMEKDILVDGLDYYNVNIDNSINNIIFDIKYIDGFNPILSQYYDNSYYIDEELNKFNLFDIVLKDIDKKIIRDYDKDEDLITITLSQKNYDIIKNNYKVYSINE